jgi:hypothetical protein
LLVEPLEKSPGYVTAGIVKYESPVQMKLSLGKCEQQVEPSLSGSVRGAFKQVRITGRVMFVKIEQVDNFGQRQYAPARSRQPGRL